MSPEAFHINSLLEHGEDDQVVDGNLGYIRVVTDRKGGASGSRLIMSVEGAPFSVGVVIQTGVWGWAVPIFRMISSVRPLSRLLSIVGERGERPILSYLDLERPPCRKLKRVTIIRRELVAASVMLHPPLILWQVI